jgi:hypothetical protein
MRTAFAAAALLALFQSALIIAQHQHGAAPQQTPGPSGGVKAAGWEARLDRANQSIDSLSFAEMGGGVHVTTGPAAIFWRPEQTATGAYTVSATFSMAKPPARPEGFGIFIGGADLKGDGQRYTYFLARHDGKVMVRRRQGAEVTTLLDWTDQAAVKQPDASGRSSNELSIAVTPAAVSFLVNGREVHQQPATAVDTSGIAGLRVNHALDVHVAGWTIRKP